MILSVNAISQSNFLRCYLQDFCNSFLQESDERWFSKSNPASKFQLFHKMALEVEIWHQKIQDKKVQFIISLCNFLRGVWNFQPLASKKLIIDFIHDSQNQSKWIPGAQCPQEFVGSQWHFDTHLQMGQGCQGHVLALVQNQFLIESCRTVTSTMLPDFFLLTIGTMYQKLVAPLYCQSGCETARNRAFQQHQPLRKRQQGLASVFNTRLWLRKHTWKQHRRAARNAGPTISTCSRKNFFRNQSLHDPSFSSEYLPAPGVCRASCAATGVLWGVTEKSVISNCTCKQQPQKTHPPLAMFGDDPHLRWTAGKTRPWSWPKLWEFRHLRDFHNHSAAFWSFPVEVSPPVHKKKIRYVHVEFGINFASNFEKTSLKAPTLGYPKDGNWISVSCPVPTIIIISTFGWID